MSVIKPESAFGLYYEILCSSLTDWIDQYLGNQIATVSGTMIVGNYTVPYIAPCLYSEPETVVLDPLQLQAESRSGIDLFPKIFEYFGKMISNQLIIWSSLSKFNNLTYDVTQLSHNIMHYADIRLYSSAADINVNQLRFYSICTSRHYT